MGAGVAALLTLKMHQRVPSVRCWAFCPPGGLVSQNLSHEAEPYCTSVIVNKDIVPRLSLQTVYRLFEGMSPTVVTKHHASTYSMYPPSASYMYQPSASCMYQAYA